MEGIFIYIGWFLGQPKNIGFTYFCTHFTDYGTEQELYTAETENKWYSHWLEKKYFNSTPDERNHIPL
jgi:hypothetical protein